MEVKTLSARLSAETAKIPGEPFAVSGAGETVALTNPETGKRYELTVTEYVPLTLDTENMNEEWEYPTRYVSVEYTLAPDATEQEVYLTDVSEGDKPRRRQTTDGFYPTATGAIFAMMRSDAEGRHSSASSFYFEPTAKTCPTSRRQPTARCTTTWQSAAATHRPISFCCRRPVSPAIPSAAVWEASTTCGA